MLMQVSLEFLMQQIQRHTRDTPLFVASHSRAWAAEPRNMSASNQVLTRGQERRSDHWLGTILRDTKIMMKKIIKDAQ